MLIRAFPPSFPSQITSAVQVALLIYVFIKLKTVADSTTFELGW